MVEVYDVEAGKPVFLLWARCDKKMMMINIHCSDNSTTQDRR